MKAAFRIRRFDPEHAPEPYWQQYEVEWTPDTVVLSALHDIHDNQDGSLAYRYSCRGAICGSCAMRINGTAALACKTRLGDLDTGSPVTLEPLLNMHVIKDLVVDQEPFFASLREVLPWLEGGGRPPQEPFVLDDLMESYNQDQYKRATDCILCECCLSDCPKRHEDESFRGPAALLSAFKRYHHPQEPSPRDRLERAVEPGGVFDCDRHGRCTKVCPKNCRPMSAIILLERQARQEGIGP
jgi:succinate dehydrogenase / fumarate reductase iron-sulfur subunit